MNEMLHLLKERDNFKKLLPILYPGTNIYTPQDRLNYIQYWNEEAEKLKSGLQDHDPADTIEEWKRYRKMRDISQQIGDFLHHMSDMLHIKIEELENSKYKELIDEIKS